MHRIVVIKYITIVEGILTFQKIYRYIVTITCFHEDFFFHLLINVAKFLESKTL